MRRLDAVVIGAGAAGIAAARRLSELGLRYELVEARICAGGRALTDNTTFGVPVDLGCHWLHSPAQNPLKTIVDELGVRYLKGDYATRLARDGRWLDASDAHACATQIEACFERIANAGRSGVDRAAAEVIGDAGAWAAAFEAEFTAKQGSTTRAGSTLDFARYVWEGDDLPVVGGLGNVIAALTRGVRVRCGTPVSLIDSTRPDCIRVAIADGLIETRGVIVTVSTGVLEGGIRFLPALPDWKCAAIAYLPMGSCNKVALGFTRPVFGELRDCLVLPQRGAHEAVEIVVRPDGHDVAICLVSGAFGRDLAREGGDAMSSYALARLCELFGESLRSAVRHERIVADWDGDPWIRGYVAVALPGHADAREALRRPIDERIYFAGEATHPTFMGDVHGAWLSGIDAADALAAAGMQAR
jgi:monoamine oxidase